MKKILLLALVAISLNGFAQTTKTWNFSEAPFGEGTTIDFTTTQVIDGLTIGTDGEKTFSLDANNKSLDGISYTHRLKTGGGGSPKEDSKIPTTRYLKIDVAGNSTINIAMMSSNKTDARTLIIVNTDETVSHEITDIKGDALYGFTYEYEGGPTSLYFYSQSGGVNYYSFSASNLSSSVNTVNANKTIISERYFDILGCEMPDSSQGGLVIRKVTYEDGTSASFKTYIRRNK